MDRRDFLKKGVVTAGVALAATAGLSACTSSTSSTSGSSGDEGSWMPKAWDQEVDIVVCGFGACGGAAAIEAADKGASVVVLEKTTDEQSGGNLSVSAGFTNLGYRGGTQMTTEDFITSSGWRVDQAYADQFISYERRFDDFMARIGAEQEVWGSRDDPNAYLVIPNWSILGCGGWYWHELMKNTVEAMPDKVSVLYETPVLGLVQNPVTGEVLGVKAGTEDAPLYIRGLKGTIMATGGFESDPELFEGTYCVGYPSPISGHPAITGDGHKLLLRAGAKYTQINSAIEWEGICFRKCSEDMGRGMPLGQGAGIHYYRDGFIIVNKDGNRFVDEKFTIAHNHSMPNPWFAMEAAWEDGTDDVKYTNLPAFMIFDQATFESGPLGRQRNADCGWGYDFGNPNREPGYVWSKDNQTELTNGYITKADTLEELCAALSDTDAAGKSCSPDATAVRAAIESYNAHIEQGTPDEFGRAVDTMEPISLSGPFYGASVVMGGLYTVGGINISADSEVLDWDGTTIPRLFAGGNLASPTVLRTPACNGAVSRGLAAADSAVALDPQA